MKENSFFHSVIVDMIYLWVANIIFERVKVRLVGAGASCCRKLYLSDTLVPSHHTSSNKLRKWAKMLVNLIKSCSPVAVCWRTVEDFRDIIFQILLKRCRVYQGLQDWALCSTLPSRLLSLTWPAVTPARTLRSSQYILVLSPDQSNQRQYQDVKEKWELQ